MNGEPEQGSVYRLGDLEVVLSPSGRTAKVLVVDTRNRRELIRLPRGEAYAVGVVLTSKARAAGAPPADPGEPVGEVTS